MVRCSYSNECNQHKSFTLTSADYILCQASFSLFYGLSLGWCHRAPLPASPNVQAENPALPSRPLYLWESALSTERGIPTTTGHSFTVRCERFGAHSLGYYSASHCSGLHLQVIQWLQGLWILPALVYVTAEGSWRALDSRLTVCIIEQEGL